MESTVWSVGKKTHVCAGRVWGGSWVAMGALVCLACSILPGVVSAAETEILRVAGRAAALEGETDGVSIGPVGELKTAPAMERLTGLDDPFVFSASSSKQGWILGTGNEGKVVQVDAQGEVTEFGRVPEPEVFAVHGAADGSVLAAGSPNGKVHRLTAGGAEMLFDPEATYVWRLAEDAKGRILAATGLPGRLVRWDGKDLEVLYESPDAHVRSLLVKKDGSIYVGTAGQGLVVRLDADGKARTLYDADEPEVLDFADAGEHVYVALLASEASYVDLSPPKSQAEGEEEVDSPTPTLGSRTGDHEGPRSVILRLQENGTVDRVARLEDETVHALAFFGDPKHDGGLWIGTGQEGRLYRLQGDELIREAELEERQLVALVPGPTQDLGIVTTNSASVYRLDGSRRVDGTYESKIYDLKQPADLGIFRWDGEAPPNSKVRVSFRTGMSSNPDATWTGWSIANDIEAQEELSLAGISGRFLQWRIELSKQPELEVRWTELSYRQRNRAPEIQSFEVQDPGQILVPQSFNPTSTTFEPWSPTRDGIFTSIRKERESNTLKTLWKKGYRTLKWEASDANDDPLVYNLEVRRDHPSAAGEGQWVTMAEGIDETWFSFDSTVLPDGIYRFRVTADDHKGNLGARALKGSELSDPVTIDHAAPELISRKKSGNGLEVEIRDARSPLRDAQWSVGGGAWQPARPVDGLLDSRHERLILDLPLDAEWVLLRLTDAAFNVVTLDLSRD